MRTLLLTLCCVILSLASLGARADDKVLNVYCWDEYLPKDVLEDFTKRTGVAVTLTLYDSNEAMLAKVSGGVVSYDLVFPSEYAVRVLAEKKLVRPLDKSKIPNWKNLDERLLDKNYDPGNQYAVPYFFGTTGIGYNKKAVGEIDSWNAVFDPKHAGKIQMLKDMRECFAAALKVMGKSVNEKDAAVLKQAGEMLKKQKPLVKSYDSDSFAEELRRGSVVIAQGYNGQIAKLVAEDPDKFGYVVPKEGATVWIDNVCIPAKAANPDAAHAFINYLLEPDVGARIVNAAMYASANKAAKAKVKPEIAANPIVYPSDEVLKRCEFMEHLGKAAAVESAIWREIRSE
jgi:spermidine/putrescine transport system substrate-binding protein